MTLTAAPAKSELQKPRHWVWSSTPATTDAGIISVLAIAETIFAIAVYGWIAYRYGTWHLAVAVCVVPFSLLRTRTSVTIAFEFIGNLKRQMIAMMVGVLLTVITIWVSVWKSPNLDDDPLLMLTFAPFALYVMPAVCVRVYSVLRGLWIERRLFSPIPENWWRYAACMDMLHPPELLPGAALHLQKSSLNDFVTLPLRVGAAAFTEFSKPLRNFSVYWKQNRTRLCRR